MTLTRTALLTLSLALGGCGDNTAEAEPAADAAEATEDEPTEKPKRNRLPGPPKRSYEHPDVPYTDAEKDDLRKICSALLACHRSRCTSTKVSGTGSDYGTLIADFIKDNEPKRSTRRVAELLKEDNLTGISSECRQLVSAVL